MTKRFFSIVSLLCVALCVMAEGRAKYVFFFIGDGMGVNQVYTAETYLAAVRLLFDEYPLRDPLGFVTDGRPAGQAVTDDLCDAFEA